jgi:hypothetical protein
MPTQTETGAARVLIRFTEAVDRRQAEEAAACFTADGLFRPGGKAVVGIENIEQLYRERFADPRRMTRHIWANVSVAPIDADSARVTALLTNYAFEPLVSETALQMRIGDVDCLVVRDAAGEWRFAEHLYQRAFATSLPLDAAPI